MWIYIESMGSTSSRESVESQSPSTHGLGQSHIVSKTDTLSPYFFQECLRENCTEHQSGMTLKPFAVPNSLKSTLSLGGSPARILALQVVGKAWKASEAVYSTKLSDSQKKLERRLCSSKTSQRLELADFWRSSENLLKWGMTVDGRVYLPQALELHTKGNAGSYLPTPTAHPYKSNKGGAQGRVGKERFSLPYMWKMGLIPTLVVSQKGYDNQANGTRTLSLCGPWRATTGTTMPSSFCEWIMGYEIGHTKLNALGTQWFQCKSGKRLKTNGIKGG